MGLMKDKIARLKALHPRHWGYPRPVSAWSACTGWLAESVSFAGPVLIERQSAAFLFVFWGEDPDILIKMRTNRSG
jgi:hypothetical protein